MPKLLSLTVNNTARLEGGTKVSYTFDEQGGTIGTAGNATWHLADRSQSVAPSHVRVFFTDDAFCLESTCDQGIRVNDSMRPLDRGRPFQVQDGDRLQIGHFDISAFVLSSIDPSQERNPLASRYQSVEVLVGDKGPRSAGSPMEILDNTLSRDDAQQEMQARFERQKKQNDPITLLHDAGAATNPVSVDPLAVIDDARMAEQTGMVSRVKDYIDALPESSRIHDAPDDRQPQSAYFSPPRAVPARAVPTLAMNVTPEPKMPDQTTPGATDMDAYLAALASGKLADRPTDVRSTRDVVTRDTWLGGVKAEPDSEGQIDHVVLRPLCRALGLPVKDMSMPEADQLAEDIGSALRTAILGLMALNKDSLAGRSLMAETHLHAIEDNPIRLARDADEVMQDLFLVQSPVHLSASAAIGESLDMVGHHQAASEQALETALQSVLQALSPLALARRFMKYKGHAPRTGDLDAWHWRMYQHYYSELASDRQGGLSRMFREVFRQVYDREMRARSSGADSRP